MKTFEETIKEFAVSDKEGNPIGFNDFKTVAMIAYIYNVPVNYVIQNIKQELLRQNNE